MKRPSVGERLRRLRVGAHLTQAEIARAARLTPKFVSQVENDRANPSIDALARIVENGLGVSLSAFFADDENVLRVILLMDEGPPARCRIVRRVTEALCDDDGGI